jgi:hypothetical protein
MARPETLIPGNCYFSVGYYDSDLLLPIVDTLLYVGQEHDPDQGRLWLFREPQAPGPGDADASTERLELIVFTDKQLHEIVDFDGLIRTLGEISANHPLKPLPQATVEPASAEDFRSVSGAVARFLDDLDYVSLTMTIRFTDDGLSLGRRDGGYDIHFFAHPRRDPDEDSKILALFASIGVQPLVDYLCDRGRTRVLQFPILRDGDVIAALCKRVLLEVYSMRRGDVLDYDFLRKSDVNVHGSEREGQAE